ncbi:uncharacterized protein [Oscarella lobularis]|uniref:uncharacterized protein n=1 Tax=Oscarella lobularis TaxID=121494 RepID=UPI0033133DDF
MDSVRIKASLQLEDSDGEGKTALSVRRTTLSVPFYRYTLKHLSADLQKLFAEDLKDYTVNSHAYVVSYGATVDDDVTDLDCDSNVQKCFLSASKTGSMLYLTMTLHFQETKTNAAGDVLPGKMEQSLSGLQIKVDPRGPFPLADDGNVQVTQPVGAGMILTPLDCDVIVAGAGSAGVGAALAAARSGARTVCIHGRPVLGGNASSEVKLHMVGADKSGGRGKENETEARESGIVDEIRLDNSMANPQFCAEMLDLTFLDKFRAEPNMTLLLNTWFTGVSRDDDGTILVAYADNQITQKRYEITGKVFIDCTGDGRLGAEAGNYWTQGREAKSQYNESLAMDVADTLTEGTSLAFHAKDMGKPMPFKPPPTFKRKFTSDDFKYRGIRTIDYGYWWIEVSYPYDNVSDGDEIMHELLEALIGIWDYIKNGDGKLDVDPTNWALDWFGLYPCKREARRLIGLHVQTQNEIVPEPTDFFDSVCHAGWNIDLHNPRGINDTEHPPFTSINVPYIYGTPLRCFISSNVPNLMFAGRLASFSHVVFGSQRVMATCMTHGQAAGTAAAYAVQCGMTPQQVAENADAVWSIQQQLLRDDQFIVHQINQDPRDMALKAKISATSELEGSEAKEVISGQTRAVFGPGGCMSGQCLPGTNRWMSSEVPATLTLEWESPITIGQVQFIFDTGLWRRLTFSIKTEDQKSMIWGQPMPETVKDYAIHVRAKGSTQWQTVATVKDNYQRRRVHDVNLPGEYTGLQVEVTATNGYDHAHICEIRVYPVGQTGKFPTKPANLKSPWPEVPNPPIGLATPKPPEEWLTGPEIPVA